MGKRMTNSEMDTIANLHFSFGNTPGEIAKKIGYSEGGVHNVIKTLTLIREGKDEELAAMIVRRSMGKNMILWAYERCNKGIPVCVMEALQKLLERSNKNIPEQIEIEEPEPTNEFFANLYNTVFRAVSDALKAVKE